MAISELSDIYFDEQDSNLFLVDDPRLRADALKHSVLPRLRVVLNTAIALVHEIYEIEVLEDSIISVFPNFREKRYKDNELAYRYESAFVGLGGQRKPKWPGFSRKDGKAVKILPFRLAFVLEENGVFVLLENGWLKGLDKGSFNMILQFHIDNENIISRLCFGSRIRPDFYSSLGLNYFAPFKDHYQHRMTTRRIDNNFIGYPFHIPVSPAEISKVVESFAIFFPVYDSYLQLAKGLPVRLDTLVTLLNDWFERQLESQEEGEESRSSQDELAEIAALAAQQKIPVMPAIRWQVFQRDNWKCVSCGRNSHNGAILHVDHIIPRSRGGLDSLENFQTLCNVCNIGKSNKDTTDLSNKG